MKIGKSYKFLNFEGPPLAHLREGYTPRCWAKILIFLHKLLENYESFRKTSKNPPPPPIQRVHFDPLVKKSDFWTQNPKYLVRLTFLWDRKYDKSCRSCQCLSNKITKKIFGCAVEVSD